MVGVINYTKLENDFLDLVNEKTDEIFCERIRAIELHKESILESLKNAWKCCLYTLGDRYKVLQESGVTGSLRFGYLSFLRSGILTQKDWYRMDYYDVRGRISEIECSECLDVTNILLCRFNECADEINKMFASQSRVKSYKADSMIYQLAERFHMISEPLLSESLSQFLEEKGGTLYDVYPIEFLIGEFFAQTKTMCVWDETLSLGKSAPNIQTIELPDF